MDFKPIKDCIEAMAWRIGRLEIKEAHEIELVLEHWFWTLKYIPNADVGEKSEYYRLRKLLNVLEHQTFAFSKPEEYHAYRCLESGY